MRYPHETQRAPVGLACVLPANVAVTMHSGAASMELDSLGGGWQVALTLDKNRSGFHIAPSPLPVTFSSYSTNTRSSRKIPGRSSRKAFSHSTQPRASG